MTFKSDFAAATAPLTPAAKTAAVARVAGLDQMGAAVQAKVQDLIFTLREYDLCNPLSQLTRPVSLAVRYDLHVRPPFEFFDQYSGTWRKRTETVCRRRPLRCSHPTGRL
jgi:hypothetical protein